jgi:hypothetical protein
MFLDGLRKMACRTSRICAGATDGAVGPAFLAAVGGGDGIPAWPPSEPVQAQMVATSASAGSIDKREVIVSGSLGKRHNTARVLDGEPRRGRRSKR